MPHEITQPTEDEYGAEVHPAFGMIGASRVSNSPPGTVLFDSDIKHAHSVVLRISRASRKRDLNHDWIHSRQELIEVEMSEAQWASFVSSMNTSGVPCTIRRTPDELQVDGLPYQPRLAESTRETSEAAQRAFDGIKKAMAAYEEKKTAANLRTLHFAIENATANVNFAGKTLNEHVENVVQRARADIEAMVTQKAMQLGLEADDVKHVLELPGDS